MKLFKSFLLELEELELSAEVLGSFTPHHWRISYGKGGTILLN